MSGAAYWSRAPRQSQRSYLLILLLFGWIGIAEARPRYVPPYPPFERLLASWGFDAITPWLNDQKSGPLLSANVQVVESWNGYALTMDDPGPALLALPIVTAQGRTNLAAIGTIRFWYAPHWATGNGPKVTARLLETGAWSSGGAAAWWSLQIDPAGKVR